MMPFIIFIFDDGWGLMIHESRGMAICPTASSSHERWTLTIDTGNAKQLDCFSTYFSAPKKSKAFFNILYMFFLKNTWSYGASWYLKLGSSEMEFMMNWLLCIGDSQLSAPRRIWGNERVDERRPPKPMLMQCNGGLHDLILDHMFPHIFQKHVNRICLIIAFFWGKKIHVMWTSVSRVRTYLLSNVWTAPSKVEMNHVWMP